MNDWIGLQNRGLIHKNKSMPCSLVKIARMLYARGRVATHHRNFTKIKV